MSELTRLRDEAERLLTTYTEFRDCNDLVVKTRVHVELDRFLMANRETAAILMLEGLNYEIERLKSELHLDFEKKPGLLGKLRRRLRKERRDDDRHQPGESKDKPKDKPDSDEWHEDPDQPKYFNQ